MRDTTTRAGDDNAGPPPGDVTPSSPGPSIASSQTKWETGSDQDQTPNSPVAHSGTTNAAATTSQPQRMPQTCAPGFVKASLGRPPIVLWLAITISALAVNLLLWNRLWAWYAFCGIVASGLAAWLVWRSGHDVPERLLYWLGVPLGLHYLGGSLSGLHQIGGPNGLYYVFPWWDNVVHFLGAAAIAVVLCHLLRHHGRAKRVLLAVAGAVTFGVVVELYEFLNFVWLGTIDQGYYTNTMLDLYYNGLGAWTAALGYTARPRSAR